MGAPHHLSRRTLVAGGGALAGLALLPGCAATGTISPAIASAPCLPKVKARAGRVIRQLVGLRPYRPSGFVVRRELLGDKHIIHNYGHGGGGITLSWGSSRLAVDLSLQEQYGPVAVLGAGIMGLTTARLLQEAGRKVTIYTSQLTPHTTSNIAGGQWYPSSVFRHAAATPAFLDQFVRAAAYSYQRFQIMTGEEYGVRWLTNYDLSRRKPRMGRIDSLVASMLPDMRTLSGDESPFGAPYARRWQGMYIEPSRFLRALQRDILIAGGKIEVRHFDDKAQLAALSEGTIFNCTGLGAAKLFGDTELTPVRGQLEILVPQPEIDYAYVAYNGAYMFPRSDGLVLGGTHDEGATDLTPDPRASQSILNRHRMIADNMRCA